ncbi:hypothetical protein Tco_1579626 [Tanacetum coccineum]
MYIPKFEDEGYTRIAICIEYEWKPPRCSTCKVFGHVLDECPKKIVLDVSKIMKIPRQTACKPPVGLKPKSNFVYRLVQPTSKTSGEKSKMDSLDKSLYTTPLAERINKLERKMLDGKLMLVDDDGKPLNKVDFDPVNSDSDSDVEVAYDKTTQFVASGGANDVSIYEDEDYDIYHTYDI